MTHRHDNARVLLVDEGAEKEALECLLRARDIDVQATNDARDALGMTTDEVPDVVLLGMGVHGGRELLSALRARDIPVIALASAGPLPPGAPGAGSTAELTAIRTEAAAYLARPVDPDALTIAITRAIETHGLRRDIAVLRARSEQFATDAKRKLRSQQELFATVAHDVRSHLAAVTMVTVSLARNALPGQERKVVLMRRAVERIESLVDDLLDLGRLEAGTLQLSVGLERAARIVGDVVARIQSVAMDRGVTVAPSVGADFSLCCDRDRVTTALEHLGAIVLRMTPRGGTMRVRAEIREGRGCLAVESDAKARGLDATSERSVDLGVVLAKAIIDAHGGVLESGGAKFEIVLPLGSEPCSGVSIVAGQEITAASS